MQQPKKEFRTRLTFKKSAKKEWDTLGGNVREKFKKLLLKRAVSRDALMPKKHQLSGVDRCFKIKLRQDGYRLIYQVTENEGGDITVTITVVTVDRREDVYEGLKAKLGNLDALFESPLLVTQEEEDE
ncbi:type II toxin-antitoxin system mRNA interferase toxin, RelE/StbE family [Chimaeribacter arupi]|uniref:Type II toxin-antitoxin system RelE/ParE family toxin n=1 Tax=Nissabacter archeti TaxID=1917880 RepID=A0ABS5JC92_9GAMM|nr:MULTISPECIES: type II toxin-antitoxin system RelE/ParE family toxin [Yersiniaceae]MBS0967577.1 type II toxin-antitoxin system RelE/ParE family toxin [Nissabacter archeti]PLR42548.1 type II toxin-antitoxin system mRNA interferase toxin, RelE/StbE family [Chimaeribacter arupi]